MEQPFVSASQFYRDDYEPVVDSFTDSCRFAEAYAQSILKQLAKLMYIEYCEDLIEDGTPWEVPCEPEPQYFATLKEAIVFRDSLSD